MLLPAVRNAGAGTVIIADGFSCREQIEQETGRKGLHLAQVLQMGLEGDTVEVYPERKYVDEKKLKDPARKKRLVLFTAAALLVVASGYLLKQKRK